MKKIILFLLIICEVAFSEHKGTCVETLIDEHGLQNVELCVVNQYSLEKYELEDITKILIETISSLHENSVSLASLEAHEEILKNISNYGHFTISKISIK